MEVDWNNDEAVVRASAPDVYLSKGNHVCMGKAERRVWLGSNWKEARKSVVVQDFEAKKRPVAAPEVPTTSSEAIDWDNDKAVVRAAVPGVRFFGGAHVCREDAGGRIWLGYNWKEARESQVVREFEAANRPAMAPEASSAPATDDTLRHVLTVDNALAYLEDEINNAFHSSAPYSTQKYQILCRHVIYDPVFQRSSGSSGGHHAHVGGLMLHTAEVVRNCIRLGGKGLRWDVLLTAAIWHDYAKTHEYEFYFDGDVQKVRTTPYRKQIGHVVGSVLKLHERARHLHIESENDIEAITHCMLAHHGRLEWRSPVEPQTDEAFLLHSADMLSAR
jgi:hypothetical protein